MGIKYAEKLLDESLETAYWIGFLTADGSFGRNGTHIALTLQKSDAPHVSRLKKYLGYEGNRKEEDIAFQNTKIVPMVMEKYDLKIGKTYNPPSASSIISDENRFMAFLIGMIDGDGCIAKRSDSGRGSMLRIKLHSSWLSWMQAVVSKLSDILEIHLPPARLNSEGYAEFSNSNHLAIKKIKTYALKFNLPFLKRKWDRVDMNFKSKQEIGKENIKRVISLKDDGFKNSVIAKKLGIGQSAVSQIISRNKNGTRQVSS